MNVKEIIARYGLIPDNDGLPHIRSLLDEEVRKERHAQGLGNTELLMLFCIQLFSKGDLDDVLTIWQAKTASMDSDGSLDIQLLCGAGVLETKSYLASLDSEAARSALSRILECEACGDFDGFSTDEQMGFYKSYFSDSDEESDSG